MSRGVFILLFRGINITGHRVARMEKLRQALADAGFADVATYIQSGNVVLTSDEDEGTIAARVETLFTQTFGFSSRPTVRSRESWRRMIAENPFDEAAEDGRRVHAIVLDAQPSEDALQALQALATTERMELRPGVLYLHTPDGFGRSKLVEGLDRFLKVPWTGRNWNTVLKLQEMAQALPQD